MPIGLVYSSEGIATAKESWLLGEDAASQGDWLEDVINERIRQERENAYQEYLRKLAEFNEKRLAEITAVQEHARRIGEYNLLLQEQAEEREQERAKVEKAAAELGQKFRRLADQWRTETMLLSSSTDKLSHPAYLKIIGMGMPAVPLILKEMEQNGGHWFLALRSITEEDPVNPDDAGRIKKMAEAWLQWGRQHHYL